MAALQVYCSKIILIFLIIKLFEGRGHFFTVSQCRPFRSLTFSTHWPAVLTVYSWSLHC